MKNDKDRDYLADRVPNDWLEALIIFLAGIGVFGGFVGLYYLWQLNSAL